MHKLKLVRGISRDLHAMLRHTGVKASMPYIAKVHERVDAYYASLMHKIHENCVGFRAEDKTQFEWICQNCACYLCCEGSGEHCDALGMEGSKLVTEP